MRNYRLSVSRWKKGFDLGTTAEMEPRLGNMYTCTVALSALEGVSDEDAASGCVLTMLALAMMFFCEDYVWHFGEGWLQLNVITVNRAHVY